MNDGFNFCGMAAYIGFLYSFCFNCSKITKIMRYNSLYLVWVLISEIWFFVGIGGQNDCVMFPPNMKYSMQELKVSFFTALTMVNIYGFTHTSTYSFLIKKDYTFIKMWVFIYLSRVIGSHNLNSEHLMEKSKLVLISLKDFYFSLYTQPGSLNHQTSTLYFIFYVKHFCMTNFILFPLEIKEKGLDILIITGDPHQYRNKHTNQYVITSSTPEWYATSVT